MAVSATLARLNRRAINPLVRTFAGRLPPLALVIHRGRVSGRVYRTPVLAFPADDRFLVALFYGADTDWVKNVLAQGGCDLVARGRPVVVTDPELRPAASAAAGVPVPVRAALRVLGTEQFLVLQQRTGATEAADADSRGQAWDRQAQEEAPPDASAAVVHGGTVAAMVTRIASQRPATRVPRKRPISRVLPKIIGVLSAVLLIASVFTYVGFRRDLSAARTRLAGIPTETYASPYGDVEYRLEGDGPTVLVSHGVNGGLDHGMRLTHQWGVFGEGYRFLYVSRFGYLRSSLPEDASARLQAAAYKALLDHLGIDRAFVFGNSAGGPSAMWFAIDYPERTQGLILHSSAVPGPDPATMPTLLAEHDLLYWAAIKTAPGTVLGLLLPESISATLTEEEEDLLIENALEASLPISARTDGIVFDNEVSTPSVNGVPFEEIRVATLILAPVDDESAEGGREMAKRIAGSEYVGLTGGHFLLRQEERLQAEIAGFVA